MLKQSQAIFAVNDVKETIGFYERVLGFTSPWFWGDPVTYGGIHCGSIHVMFNQLPEVARGVEGHQHHFFADDIESLYALHQKNGAPILSPLENKPWRMREYTVRDPNGYHLRFAGPTKFEKPAGSLSEMPGYIRIDDRLPTWSEFRALHAAVKWGELPATSSGILESSNWGVVAIDTRDGSVIGTSRAMRDARGWFSIWDVIVDPAYQSQRVGSAMVQRLLERIRQDAPSGGNVFLFTFSHPFYEKLGFREETCSMVRL